jgi:hypothetical protein
LRGLLELNHASHDEDILGEEHFMFNFRNIALLFFYKVTTIRFGWNFSQKMAGLFTTWWQLKTAANLIGVIKQLNGSIFVNPNPSSTTRRVNFAWGTNYPRLGATGLTNSLVMPQSQIVSIRNVDLAVLSNFVGSLGVVRFSCPVIGTHLAEGSRDQDVDYFVSGVISSQTQQFLNTFVATISADYHEDVLLTKMLSRKRRKIVPKNKFFSFGTLTLSRKKKEKKRVVPLKARILRRKPRYLV